jgi:tRNA (guanine26-N2/guanine27-N2)-dimethyltransferase
VEKTGGEVLVKKIFEGKTKLLVPEASIQSTIPPRTPAFFNPKAELNRDISMAAYRIFSKDKTSSTVMADSLAGVGARGIRVAKEVPDVKEVHINDGNLQAVNLAKKSANLNLVSEKCFFSVLDICRFLTLHSAPKKRFTILDIDPFGSPAPYLDCALRSIENNGLLSTTATDMPVLCGVYPKVSYRKYQGHSLRTEYSHEIGIRLLFGSVAHNAMRLGLGIKPVFSYRMRHYFRVYMTIHTGAAQEERTYKEIGFILHCFKCGHRTADTIPNKECFACKTLMKHAGPLWTGPIHNKNFLAELIHDFDMHSVKMGSKIASIALQEIDMPPTYFTIDKISRQMGVATPSINSIIMAIKKEGYRASRTALNSKGIKTDASNRILQKIVKMLA